MLKNYPTTNQARIVTALILTGILSISSGLTFIKNATAASTNLLPDTTNEVLKQNIKLNRLPRPVANAVLRDLAQRLGIFTSQLKIINYSQQTWRDGCLELPQPDELCTQALVPGWLVVVSNNRQNWIYHTNNNGRSLRLASANTSSDNFPSQLPASVKNRVLQAASRRLQLPISRLTVIQAQQQTWRDGCLELGNINESCIAALTPGWRVVIGAADQTLVYHSNQTGSVIKLNDRAGDSPTANNGTVQPLPIPASELPPPLDRGVVFRQISSGGFAGRTYETVLLNDGSLIRVRIGDANDSERSVRRISRQEVQKFQQLLERYRFGEYKNLNYPAPSGAADYITYTLTSREGTVQYNDFSQNNLAQNLQKVVKAWNQISNSQVSNGNTGEAVPIPASELPPPLDRGVVFRQISSGGLFPRTYETVLLNDGRLIRVRIGDANDSDRSVRRISTQQVRQFEQLLERLEFSEYQNQSYPAPSGAADYITYTLTSQEATVQYNDISQNNLPQNLREVVDSWNRIVSNAQT